MNRPFDFEKYIADAVDKKQTLSRLFLLFRELQSALNPFSSCKPESTDYIAPFPRTGPGLALDGLPKYDLAGRNPEFFQRLHRFLTATSDAGLIVEVVLFSNTYNEDIWALNPLHHANNINALAPLAWCDYTTRRDPSLFAMQLEFTRMIVRELNVYENIIYEVCNEPGGNIPGIEGSPTSEEVDDWISVLIAEIRSTERSLTHQHLIAGQEAFKYQLATEEINERDVHQFSDKSFGGMDYDIVNMHPLSNMWHRGVNYDLGRFMRGSLRLRALRDYCLAMAEEAKPMNLDEDNAASRFMDPIGWTIHRKRAWTTLMSGAHYDMIDFSINRYQETGTPQSQAHLRKWMKILSEFIHALDLVEMKPCRATVKSAPAAVCVCTLRNQGDEGYLYLADERESDDLQAGKVIHCELIVDLADADYELRFFCPTEGTWSDGREFIGSPGTVLVLPPFRDDLAVSFKKRGFSAAS